MHDIETAQCGELKLDIISDNSFESCQTDPKRFVFVSHLGAYPSDASPTNVRDARKSTPLPDEKALVMTTALIMDGRTFQYHI